MDGQIPTVPSGHSLGDIAIHRDARERAIGPAAETAERQALVGSYEELRERRMLGADQQGAGHAESWRDRINAKHWGYTGQLGGFQRFVLYQR